MGAVSLKLRSLSTDPALREANSFNAEVLLAAGIPWICAVGNGDNMGGHYPIPRDITSPGDSPHPWYGSAGHSAVIAVGATDWSDDGTHLYSSRGPTSDKRIKPDLTAPSGVSTETYGKFNFYGTSASTAHVAGAIALLQEKTFFSMGQILEIIKARAVDLGTAGKDNLYGEGRLNLIK